MSRVIPVEVKQIVATDIDSSIIQVWIDAANTVVNDNSDCIGGDEAKLTQVELYLSAHFISLVDPDSDDSKSTVKKESAEGLTTEYSVSEMTGKVTDTVYGRTANMLSNGCLVKSDKEVCRIISL